MVLCVEGLTRTTRTTYCSSQSMELSYQTCVEFAQSAVAKRRGDLTQGQTEFFLREGAVLIKLQPSRNHVTANKIRRRQSSVWMAVRNFVLLQNLLSKPKAFGTAFFWACCARRPQPLCLCSVFGPFVLNICVSPRSLGGRAGSAPPASSGLSCCHEFVLFFLQMLVVFCCFKRCWNWPVRGLGGAKRSDTLTVEICHKECFLQFRTCTEQLLRNIPCMIVLLEVYFYGI